MDRRTLLTDEQAERVRDALRKLVDKYGSQSELQRVTKIPQQHVSKILSNPPTSRPGFNLAQRVAKVLNISYFELVDGVAEIEPRTTSPQLQFLPGWREAATEALSRYPRLTPEMVATVGEIQARKPPARVTAEFIMNLAMAWEIGMATVKDETAAAKQELEIQRRTRKGRS